MGVRGDLERFKLLTGAIAGMLGGALHGTTTIPERWLKKKELHVVMHAR